MQVPYPQMIEDPALEPDLEAEGIRNDLDISDVLATVGELLTAIDEDKAHPFYDMIAHCVRYGTSRQTGVRSQALEFVGAKVEPYVEQAIEMVVRQHVMEGD